MFALWKDGKLPFHRDLVGSLAERRDTVVRAALAHFDATEIRWVLYEDCVPNGIATNSACENRQIAVDTPARPYSSVTARIGTERGVILVDVPAEYAARPVPSGTRIPKRAKE